MPQRPFPPPTAVPWQQEVTFSSPWAVWRVMGTLQVEAFNATVQALEVGSTGRGVPSEAVQLSLSSLPGSLPCAVLSGWSAMPPGLCAHVNSEMGAMATALRSLVLINCLQKSCYRPLICSFRFPRAALYRLRGWGHIFTHAARARTCAFLRTFMICTACLVCVSVHAKHLGCLTRYHFSGVSRGAAGARLQVWRNWRSPPPVACAIQPFGSKAPPGDGSLAAGRMDITAQSIELQPGGRLSADGLGHEVMSGPGAGYWAYGAVEYGGGHGGPGGCSSACSGSHGSTYDSAMWPVEAGSGGGGDSGGRDHGWRTCRREV